MSFPLGPCAVGALKQYDRRCHGAMDCPSKPTRFWLHQKGYTALCPEHSKSFVRFIAASIDGGYVELTLQELELAEVQES